MDFLRITVFALTVIAVAGGIAAKIRIAAPLILVILGIGTSLLPFVPDVQIEPEIVLTLFFRLLPRRCPRRPSAVSSHPLAPWR
ncbi:hypothetical protein GCM10010401_22410 [Rarobacter faecitabidus]|uniref:hypothetical protein n=1 Tax=Rarobacter faecitabidus TaxID=13243 RepID=UPI00114F4331|nr:hypothetical protein [Rarobacter faecitabidus]